MIPHIKDSRKLRRIADLLLRRLRRLFDRPIGDAGVAATRTYRLFLNSAAKVRTSFPSACPIIRGFFAARLCSHRGRRFTPTSCMQTNSSDDPAWQTQTGLTREEFEKFTRYCNCSENPIDS